MADPDDAIAALVRRLVTGDRRAIARALTVVERNDESAWKLIELLAKHGKSGHVVGVTGAGGAGKSTLIASMATEWRQRGETVGIVAVDPSSAKTGGALLGDRVRMEDLHTDPGVFVRSMATRGAHGGLSATTAGAVSVLVAAGFQRIVIETIGVGQDEIAVAREADTIVLVEAPNMGDDVQALKAGLAEIADIFVVSKADQPGADRSVSHLRSTLALNAEHIGWSPIILKVAALNGTGIAELLEAVDTHRIWLDENRASRSDGHWSLVKGIHAIPGDGIKSARIQVTGSTLQIGLDSWSTPGHRALLNRIITAIHQDDRTDLVAIERQLLDGQSVLLPIVEETERSTG